MIVFLIEVSPIDRTPPQRSSLSSMIPPSTRVPLVEDDFIRVYLEAEETILILLLNLHGSGRGSEVDAEERYGVFVPISNLCSTTVRTRAQTRGTTNDDSLVWQQTVQQ
jgi:hypothetical protein